MKLHTLFATLGLAVAAAACGGDGPTEPLVPGPPPALPAGADTVTTASGLKYVDIAAGSGVQAQAGDRVTVHYTLWLAADLRVVDTSVGRAPLAFLVGQNGFIAGWSEGITGMRERGRRRLIVPPALGYGSAPVRDRAGNVVIPGSSTLIFDVEVLSISR